MSDEKRWSPFARPPWRDCKAAAEAVLKARELEQCALDELTQERYADVRGRHPHIAIARFIYADIAHESPVYAPLGRRRRTVALAAVRGVLRTRKLNVLDDALRPLLARPRLHSLDRALHTLAQRLQG